MGEENSRELRQATRDPDTRAILEDYRAGLGVDREHEEDDRRPRRHVALLRPAAPFAGGSRGVVHRLS
jgi:hypothetical protein